MRTAAGYVGTRITNDWNVKVEARGGRRAGGREGREGSPWRLIPHHTATHWPLILGDGPPNYIMMLCKVFETATPRCKLHCSDETLRRRGKHYKPQELWNSDESNIKTVMIMVMVLTVIITVPNNNGNSYR